MEKNVTAESAVLSRNDQNIIYESIRVPLIKIILFSSWIIREQRYDTKSLNNSKCPTN